MRYVCVVPYTYQPFFDEFMATCKIPKENILAIDNTTAEKNIGCMASHNKGIDFMKARGADWLVVISPAIRFGDAGGLDFLQILENHPDYHVIHGASENVEGGKQADPAGGGHNKVFGWHLTAFNKSVFESIGRWDTNFSNYGFDDIDLSIRIRKGIPNVKWDTFPCDVTDTRMSHSIHFNPEIVDSPSTPRIMYFKRKWGRAHGDWQAESYDHPFNIDGAVLSYFPEPDDPLSIQNNEFVTLGGDING